MSTVVLSIHLVLATAMILIVMLQQSEGGGLGIGGSGGGMGGFMTGRATANLLTRATAIIAAAFMATSLLLAILADPGRSSKTSIIDQPDNNVPNQQPIQTLPSLPPIPSLPTR